MVFSSYLFIFFFLPLALLGYYTAPKKLRHLALTIFSYIFYGWANPSFCKTNSENYKKNQLIKLEQLWNRLLSHNLKRI